MDSVSIGFKGDTSGLTPAIDTAKSAFADIRTVVDRLAGSFDDANKAIASVKESSSQAQASVGEVGTQLGASQGPLAAFATRAWEMRQAIDGFKTLGGAQAGVTGFVGAVESGFLRIAGVVGIAITAVTAAISAVAAVAIEATHFGENLRTVAGATDQSVETMSRLKAVADRSGLGIDELGKSFEEMQRKARTGDDTVTTALKAIGVSVREAASLSQDALAVRLADAFSKAKDSANKTQAGVELFGDAAAKLVPQLDQGAERLLDLYAAATRAGIVIGPELSAKLQGTERGIQGFRDAMNELKQAMQGAALQSFVQFKGAIDSLIQLFTDIVGNIARLVEWFNDLDGAGQRSGQTLGLMGQAANTFAGMIIRASASVEEFGVRAGASLVSFGSVAAGIFSDTAGRAARAANAIYETLSQAILGVIRALGDLGSAFAHAFRFDSAGTSAAYRAMGSDIVDTASKIKSALTPGDLSSATVAAWKAMNDGASASAKTIDGVIARIEAQKKAQLELLAAGGSKGSAVTPSTDVGNPRADKEKGGGAEDRNIIDAALREADGQIQALKSTEQQKAMLAEAGSQLHQSTENEMTASTRTALDERYNAEKAIYDKIAQMDGLRPTQHQEILNKLKRAQEQFATDTLRLQIQAAQATQRTWDQATDEISGAFQGQVDGIIQGTTTIGQAFKNVLQQMAGDVVKFCIGWAARHAEVVAENMLGINADVLHHVAGETTKTAATEAGVATRVSSEIAGAAASAAAMLASVGRSIAAFAAQAFAGVTAFFSAIMGPAALGPATAVQAAVMAVVPSFATGAWQLPSDTMALLHQGEMVVPAAPAQAFRDAVSGGGAARGGGDIFHAHITSLDRRGIADFARRNGKDLMRGLKAAHRHGAFV